MPDLPSKVNESSLIPFILGLILGQLSVFIFLLLVFKFFIFGNSPSPDIIAHQRTTERQSSTQAQKRSLLSNRTTALNTNTILPKKTRNSLLRSPPLLSTRVILNKTSYDVNSHRPESLDWFNVLIAQTIAQFRADAQDDDAILTSLTEVMNGGSRPDFIDEIRITEISLGEEFPILSNCRIIPVDEDGLELEQEVDYGKNATRDSGRLQARMDVELNDVITLALETKLLLNFPKPLFAVLPVALSVSVVRFSGTLSVSFIPGSPQSATLLAFSFLDNYRLDLSIRSLVGSRCRLQDLPKISQLVENRLHVWFDERAVEPRFQQIELPSLWPRKKNTRGGEDEQDRCIDGLMQRSNTVKEMRSKEMDNSLNEEILRDLPVNCRVTNSNVNIGNDEGGLKCRKPTHGNYSSINSPPSLSIA
ncbi:BgTH12-04323 [Blumeria graminis f. sp. triticale]|uniref:Maintenance of mitochondrial morphology protein 1 n=1 Tax=Blumeria graminis f. sp. triticale TaxID=1689686 RepID=A0A9W4CYJ5_BLUGR|nr:BgTH12-04323 [Blumeria graminis f. sp. triticale]